MDISDIGTGNEAARMPLLDPRTVEPLIHDDKEMFISGYAVGTEKYKEAEKRVRDRYIGSDDNSQNLQIEIYAESVTEVEIFMNGEWIDAETNTLFNLFKKYGWILNQYALFTRNPINFLAKLPES